MSRNLLSTDCVHCEHDVELLEDPRPITEENAGHYFEEYKGMEVAEAECPACKAEYLAWITPPQAYRNGVRQRDAEHGKEHYDLSYRSGFNDEPNPQDLPKYNVARVKKCGPDLDGSVTWHRMSKTAHHPDSS